MNEATMNEADMNESNPYSAPGSDLGNSQSATYEPKVISFSGRLGRMRYVAYNLVMSMLMNLALIPIMGATAFVGGAAGPESMGTVSVIVTLLVVAISLVFSVMFIKRRLNDLNRSGWWMLLFLVPLVNLILAIYLLFFPGAEGANNFGPAPAPNSAGVKIIFWLFLALFVLGIGSAIMLPMMLAGSA